MSNSIKNPILSSVKISNKNNADKENQNYIIFKYDVEVKVAGLDAFTVTEVGVAKVPTSAVLDEMEKTVSFMENNKESFSVAKGDKLPFTFEHLGGTIDNTDIKTCIITGLADA